MNLNRTYFSKRTETTKLISFVSSPSLIQLKKDKETQNSINERSFFFANNCFISIVFDKKLFSSALQVEFLLTL